MRFAGKLYVSEGIKDSRKLRFRLKHGKLLRGCYVIVLCDGRDELEIYHCAYLRQRFYKKYPFRVVGLAGNYEEALLLVERMVQDTYAENGDYKIKEYLSRQFIKKKKSGNN